MGERRRGRDRIRGRRYTHQVARAAGLHTSSCCFSSKLVRAAPSRNREYCPGSSTNSRMQRRVISLCRGVVRLAWGERERESERARVRERERVRMRERETERERERERERETEREKKNSMHPCAP